MAGGFSLKGVNIEVTTTQGRQVIIGLSGEDIAKDWLEDTKISKEDIKSIVCREDVRRIIGNAFCGCPNLETFTVRGHVGCIVCNAFNYAALTNVTLGSVDKIEYEAFNHCSHLKTFIVTGHVGTIYDTAFNGCQNLTDITLGSVVIIQKGPYSSTSSRSFKYKLARVTK